MPGTMGSNYKKSELGDNMRRPTAKKKLRPWTNEGIQILKAMVREKIMTSVTPKPEETGGATTVDEGND